MVRIIIAIAVAGLRVLNLPLRCRRRQDMLLLISRQHRSTSADFRRIITATNGISPDTKIVVLNHRSTRNLLVEAGRIVEQMWYLAAARAVIVDTYIIPVSVLPPVANRPVVQIWHAIGAVKKFGLASVGTSEGTRPDIATGMYMHRGYTAVACGGEWAQGTFAEGFNVPRERVGITGQPRHDALVDPAVAEIGQSRVRVRYPQVSDGKPVIVYAPTMRRSAAIDLNGLCQAVANLEAHVVVSLHPLDDRTVIPEGLIDGRKVSTSDWLAIADHVVTDYSAIGLEAAILGLPVWFYPFDIETYRASPGLFVDPVEQLPAITACNPDELRDLLHTALQGVVPDAAHQTWAELHTGFGATLDGHATVRVLGLCGITTATEEP